MPSQTDARVLRLEAELDAARQEIERLREKCGFPDCGGFLAGAVNRIRTPFVVQDEQHRIIFANDAACAFLRLPRDGVLGRTERELFPSERGALYAAHIERTLRDGSARLPDAVSHRTGQTRWLEVESVCYDDWRKGGRFVVSVMHDVTERRQAEEGLRESEVRFRSVAESVPGVICQRLEHPDGSFAYSYVSPRCEDFFGISPEEVLEQPELLHLHPRHKPSWQAAVRRALDEGALISFEGEATGHAGIMRHWRCIARPERRLGGTIALTGIVVDISELKLVEQALAENETRLRAILDNTPAAIVITSRADGMILFANRFLSRLFGLDESEMVGVRTLPGLFEESEAMHAEFARFVQGERAALELEGFDTEGEPFWVLASASPVDYRGEDAALVSLIDITARKKAEQALCAAEETYRTIFENAAEGIFQSTVEGRFIKVNPAMARLLRYESPEALMAGVRDIGRDLYADAGRRAALIAALTERGSVTNVEVEFLTADGRCIWVSLSASVVRDERGNLLRVEGLVEDITARKLVELKLREKATQDDLTRLPNRYAFRKALGERVLAARESGARFAVAYIDLDGFKHVNDTFGHRAGDDLLRTLAERVRERLGEGDMAARLGGDEFAAVLWNVGDEAEAKRRAESILEAISRPVILPRGAVVSVGASVGLALYPQSGDDPMLLLEKADAAMYMVKRSGKNAWRMADGNSFLS